MTPMVQARLARLLHHSSNNLDSHSQEKVGDVLVNAAAELYDVAP
jgi:hypothetical protein